MGDLVSIILTTFNSEKYLSFTIDSVISQTYKNWELLIIDDASYDNTDKIIKKYVKLDKRIKFIVLETNSGGPAKPRNIGIESSNGKLLSFLDSDDIWHPDKLRIQLDYLAKFNNDLISCACKKFRDKISFKKINTTNINVKKIRYVKLIKGNTIVLSSVLLKKQFLNSIKFDEGVNYVAIEDYDMWLTLHKNTQYSLYLNEQLVGYRITENSLSTNKFNQFLKVKTLLKKHTKGIKYYYCLMSYVIKGIKKIIK